MDFLTGGKGKWNSTKKNPHESILKGSLTEEAKVWFYFIASIIIPTKHLCTIRENEAIILYSLLKGYKFDVGKIIETSIKTFHKIVKRGLVPVDRPKHTYKFIAQLPKDYYLIPGKLHHKTC